tara:strand:+ start:401 stop:661 length:261 start_codon:yes stop_codon:yes gene_type:complete
MTEEPKVFTFKVEIMLRREVLDPQGETINQSIKNNSLNNVLNVRQGKLFELQINSSNLEAAKKQVESICKNMLANPVIEEYKIFEA